MTDRPENVGAGALFRNDCKEKPSQPDYRGDITILGEKYLLAGWVKEGKKGKYLSIVARPDDVERKPATPAAADVDIPLAMIGRIIRLPVGFRVDGKGKVVRCTKHLDVSTRLRQRSSKRVRVAKEKPGPA